MKTIIFLIAVSAIFGVLFMPYVFKEKQCYETADAGINDIGYYTASKALSTEEVCKRRSNVLINLEDCIHTATGSGTLMKYANDVVRVLVSWVRPLTKGLYTLKEEHNNECYDFTTYQLQ
jgi:hypothetical protein